MISIVIPTYNEEKCIAETIKQFTVYKKKYNLEIIVSDASSIDKTAKIAKKIADQVVILNKRGTIAKGRNFGAKHAKGDIILEMDADCRIGNPDLFFQTVLNTFKDEKVVAAMSRLRIYPEEENFKDKFFHFLMNSAISIANKFGSFLSKGECQIFRKSAFEKIGGYNDDIVVGEDCDLFRRLAKVGRVKILKNIVMYHSPRRFRKTGYLKLFLIDYLKNGISLLLTKKSFSKEWKPVR